MNNPSLRVFFTGTPNVGKTTLFNQITGLKQHVGNWPGKTVEHKSACIEYSDYQIQLTDLPGAYSLTSISEEERIARDELLSIENATVVVVLNAAQLERGLNFLAEIFLLGHPVVIALNMMDVARKNHVHVDPEKLSLALGIPVVPVIAREDDGVEKLLSVLVENKNRSVAFPEDLPTDRMRQAVLWIKSKLSKNIPERVRLFFALKILEGDQALSRDWLSDMPEKQRVEAKEFLQSHEDFVVSIATWRRDWVRQICLQSGYEKLPGVYKITDQIDRFAAHPWIGFGIFALVLYLLFSFVFMVGAPLQELLDTQLIAPLSALIHKNFPHSFLGSVLADGLVSGVGLVLSFVPVLFLFFGGMALLEDIGYMTRAAYVMDRFMHRIGLHGRSFVPLFMGMGCNVPAMMATRVIDDKPARLLTMLLIPLMPCSARLAIIAFFGAAFFPDHSVLFSWLMMFLPIVTLVIIGFIASRFFMPKEVTPLIMELPLYHTPHFRSIFIQLWVKTSAFIKQAGGLIACFTLLIAALSWHPSGDIAQSILGRLGYFLEPIGKLFGSDWRLVVALITSFIVKENTIATLGVLTHSDTEQATLDAVRSAMTPEGAISFMVVQMLFIPCVSTLITYKREVGSWRFPLLGMALQMFISLICGIILYQVTARF